VAEQRDYEMMNVSWWCLDITRSKQRSKDRNGT